MKQAPCPYRFNLNPAIPATATMANVKRAPSMLLISAIDSKIVIEIMPVSAIRQSILRSAFFILPSFITNPLSYLRSKPLQSI